MAGKTVKQLYGNGTGQSFMDRVNAAKHSFTGSGLAKVVCKATTEEIAAPKKKHLEYLVQCTFEQNVSIPELANLLIERTQQSNWVIVFKALITVHHLMNYGNERFFQYLASNNSQLSLSNFTDRTGIQAFDMSKFVRQYSRYVEQKSRSYRDMAFDFCKIKRGKEEGVLRKMTAEKLMKTIPILEVQLDSMLDFDANGSEINHSIVYAAFLLLYKDAIRLFATYNDGMINLIEKYFTMTKKQCREALNCYKNFTKRMDRLNKFLKLAEELGCGEKDGLELQPVPPAVLEALENHLNMLEGKKGPELSSTSGLNKSTDSSEKSFTLTDIERQRIIDEEKAKLEEFAAIKSQTMKTTSAHIESGMTKSQSSGMSQPSCKKDDFQSKSMIKPSDDLVLLDLDPQPFTNAQPPFISAEVADIFGVSTTVASNHTTAISNDPFAPDAQFNLSGNKDFNFDKAFGVNSKFVNDDSKSSVTSIAYQPHKEPENNQPNVQLSLDAKLASLVGNLDIGPGTRGQTNNITTVNWNNSTPKSGFEANQSKANSVNWPIANNQRSQTVQMPSNNSNTAFVPQMHPITTASQMPGMYTQSYQPQMVSQFGQSSYNANFSNCQATFGQQPQPQYPFTSLNTNAMPFQTPFTSYPQQPYSQFGSF